MPETVETDFVSVRYGVPRWNPAWAVPEVPVPENVVHDSAIDYLKALLIAWARRVPGGHGVFRNLGIRWMPEEPRSGFDPDVSLVANAPREEDGVLTVLELWRHPTPRLAIEVVSPGHPYKDYVDAPERAAACKIPELWVYDPLMKGPGVHGGPHVLQVFRTTDAGYTRVHAGPGPAYSAELDAFLHPTETRLASQAKLRISKDRGGKALWLTAEEHQEQQRLAAEQRVRQLEAELRRRGR